MSLISDALRAAQDARSASTRSSARAAAAKRILTPPVRAITDRRGASVPRQLSAAAALFGVAAVIAAGVVLSAPDAEEIADRVVPPAARLAVSPLLARDRNGGEAAAPDRASSAGARSDAARTGTGDSDAPPRAGVPAAGGDPAGSAARVPPAAPAPTTRDGGRTAGPGERATRGTVAQPALGFELRLGEPAREAGDLFLEARAAQARRDYTTAAVLYERALSTDPNNAETLNNLGTVHQAMGDMGSAREAFRRAIDVSPGYAAAWSNLGVALAATGEPAQARAALAEAIRLDPGNHGASVNLALEYQKQGLTGEARRLLQDVVEASPEMPEAHYALARLLEQAGDRAGAVLHYHRFLSTGADRFPSLAPAVRQRVAELGG